MIGLGLTLCAERPDRRRLRDVASVFLAAAAAPSALTLLLFWLAMPLGQALRDPLGHWLSASRTDVASFPFYRLVMGVDDVGGSVTALLTSAFWYAVALGPAALLALALRKPGKHRRAVTGALFVAVLAVSGIFLQSTLPVNVTYAHQIAPVNAATVSSLIMGVAWGTGGLCVPLVGMLADTVGIAHALTVMAFVPLIGAACVIPLPREPRPPMLVIR